MKKSKLLFVIAILMVIFAGIALLNMISTLDTNTSMNWLNLSGVNIDEFASVAPPLYISVMVGVAALMYYAFELTGGILGIISYKKPYKYTSFIISLGVGMLVLIAAWSIALFALIPYIQSVILSAMPAGFDRMNLVPILTVSFVFAMLIQAVLPTLYLISAVRHNRFSKEAERKPDPDMYNGTLQ